MMVSLCPKTRILAGKITQVVCTVSVQQPYSSESSQADQGGNKLEKLSKNITLRTSSVQSLPASRRPIVLIYGWLVAKSKHIHKYGDFYLGKGFDVLHIKLEPQQLLWPARAQRIVEQIAEFVCDASRRTQPLLVHGFSVGGYLYGETMVKFLSDPVKYSEIPGRIKGQVFDSPADYQSCPKGVGQALTQVPVLQNSIRLVLESHMKIFYNQVTSHFEKSSQTFYDNPFRTPSLVFYSRSDPIGVPEPIERAIDGWKKKNIVVQSRCWQDTPHVSHFIHHPMEYIGLLNGFLHHIGVIDETPKVKQSVIN